MPAVASYEHPESNVAFQPLERLTMTLSSQFVRLQLHEIEPAIVNALEQVARVVDVEASALAEFTENGGIRQIHAWPGGSASESQRRLPRWLLDRCARNELTSVSCIGDLPIEERTQTWREGTRAGLGVPVLVAGHTSCALIIWGRRSARSWPDPVVDRVRLIAEILGLALQRSRHESATRAHPATIERLATRHASGDGSREVSNGNHDIDHIVGNSAALQLALNRMARVAPTNSSVLLLGETGTGKELFAQAVHCRSRRRARALVRVNCAALPPTLVESELFGHEKGAFTGAVSARQGRFELADGGTIFLDEIGDLPPDLQTKLLRVLQEGEFERVGSSRTRRVDVRVIAATHRELSAEVAAGRFRGDLFYRLSVYPIRLPALRERREDIPALVWFFVHRHQQAIGREITKVPDAVMDALQRHSWPGNVRELENVVECAMIQSSGDTLQLDDLFGDVAGHANDGTAKPQDDLDSVQRAHIEAILLRCGGRINGRNNAAERLGLHPNTLRFRMKKLGIVGPSGRGQGSLLYSIPSHDSARTHLRDQGGRP